MVDRAAEGSSWRQLLPGSFWCLSRCPPQLGSLSLLTWLTSRTLALGLGGVLPCSGGVRWGLLGLPVADGSCVLWDRER